MNDPWFRMHANIADKPVVWRLSAALHISQAKAVGHLAMFWGKVSQHAPHGHVAELPDTQLEAWAGWEGKKGVFAKWLRADHLTDGIVNEYEEYSGKLEERRQRDRDRKAAAKAAQGENGIPPERRRNSSGKDAESGKNSSVRNETIRNDTKGEQQTPTPSGRTRGKPAPWMAEINRVWAEVFPEAKAPTGAAKMLSSIVDKFGIERVAAELGVYLRATKPQFLSLPKFTATFGGASSDAKAQNPTAYAARLIRFYVEHGFSQVLPIEQHDARIDELAAEHKIKDPERVKRELRIVAPWMTLRGMKAGESARYEERVAKLLQDAPGVAA